jgi:OOP family OmpA-OmpF porin
MKLIKDLFMKIFKISLLAALISSPLSAEVFDETWEIGVFGDYIKSSTNKDGRIEWENIQEGKGYGVDLHKIINDKWNARIELASDYYDIEHAHDIDFGLRYGLDAVYKIEDSGLYLFTGAKRFNNAKSYYALNVGAGYNYKIDERFTLYGEAAVYRDINNGYTDQGLKIGLRYAFGDVKKSPVVNKKSKLETMPKQDTASNFAATKVIIVDTDNDGVSDENDHCNNTPANVKVDSKGCSLYSNQEAAINLNVLFEHNSAQLAPTMVNNIQRLADFMKVYKNTSVVIEGHSSAVGSAKYNLALSKERADSVQSILIDQFNIDASRLSSVGFGETQLLSHGNTSDDHELNRRVVAKIKTTVKTEIKKD